MEPIKSTARRIHPLVAAASVSVIILSGVGVAAITGVLPSSHGSGATPGTIATAPASPTAVIPPNGAVPPDANTPPPPVSPQLAGTAPPPPAPGAVPDAPAPVPVIACNTCGTVEGVRVVEHQAKPSGVGAVAGALIGGVLGNRFGGGNGRALMTVGGAVGGGVAGNEIEKHAHTTVSYVTDVRMGNGKLRHFNTAAQPGWHTGDQVKVVDGKLMVPS